MLKRAVSLCIPVENRSMLMIIRKKSWLKDYLKPRASPIPPYHHVCQIGDPVLRANAEPVEPEIITSDEFKVFTEHLVKTMRNYGGYGLAAPQIGLSVQVFAIETTEAQVKECVETKSAGQPVEVVPLTVFINPKLKILDYNTMSYPESCASVFGYIANVPRLKSIQIEALDVTGKKFIWKAKGWPARIAQHEMDHLQGKLYTDKMDAKTFHCAIWSIVNESRGKVSMKFYPDCGSFSRLKNMFQ